MDKRGGLSIFIAMEMEHVLLTQFSTDLLKFKPK